MQNTNNEQKKTYCPNGWAKIDTRIEEDPKFSHASSELKDKYKSYFQELQIEIGYLAMIWAKYISYSKSQRTNISFKNLSKDLLLTFQTYYKLTKEQLQIINKVFCKVGLFDKFYRILNYFKWNDGDLKDKSEQNSATTATPQPRVSLPQKVTLRKQLSNRKAHLKRRGILDFMNDNIYQKLLSLTPQPTSEKLSQGSATPIEYIETLELKKEEQPIIKKLSLAYKDSYIPYVKEENPRSAEFRENEPKSISSIFKTSSLGKQYNHTNESEDCNSTPTENENRGVFYSVA